MSSNQTAEFSSTFKCLYLRLLSSNLHLFQSMLHSSVFFVFNKGYIPQTQQSKLTSQPVCICFQDGAKSPPDPQEEEEGEEEERLEAACQQLASEAVKRGCADNVTVILVSIRF